MKFNAEINANVRYPTEAYLQGISGDGIIKVAYSNDVGTITDIKILQSTGYNILDDAMLNAIKSSDLPAPKCNNEFDTIYIDVPFSFRLPGPTVEKPEKKSSPRPSPIPLHESTG